MYLLRIVFVSSLIGAISTESNEEDIHPSVKVYVYDLPPRFNYEIFDDVLCGWHVRGFNHYFNGMGSPVPFAQDQDTLRNTDQYTLEIVVHDRMLSYSQRVFDKSEADLFYVPFYIGYAFHKTMIDDIWDIAEQQAPLKAISMDVLEHLRIVEGVTDDMWAKHFITVGREEGVFSGGRFTLFSDPDLAPLKEMLRIHYRQDCTEQFGSPWAFDQTCPLEHNLGVVVVPQVATVHAVSGEKLPWRDEYKRLHIATFVGNDRQKRHAIIEQLQPQNCKDCRLEISDDAKNISGPTIEQVFAAYSTSEFCLQPWGDGPLRRGIYDSIALGCIPVFFLRTRRPWDTFLDYEDFSITIASNEQTNVIKVLENISAEKRAELRSNLQKFGQYFQWSFGSPTIMDAFDVAMVEVSYVASVRGAAGSMPRTKAEYCTRCGRFAERFSDAVQTQRDISAPSYRDVPNCDPDREIPKKRMLQLLQISGGDWVDYGGYAASFGGDPLRLYHADLTASLGACKARCAEDTTCYAVEWSINVECRLYFYKPSVYVYPPYEWTVSIQKRPFDTDECQGGTDNCDANADCFNTVGSFNCVCKTGYVGSGVTCYAAWDEYPGYAATWSGSPLRLYHADHADLTASLDPCKARCAEDTTCYSVEWRLDVECRLFSYKPSVYEYPPYDWTVSIQQRPVVASDDKKSSTGKFGGDSFGTFDNFEDSGKPFEDFGKHFAASDDEKSNNVFGGDSFGTFDDFGDSGKPFGDFSKTSFASDDEKSKTAKFGGDSSGAFDDFVDSGDFGKTFGFRWSVAGVGLGIFLTILAVKVTRRRRGITVIPSVYEV